MVLQKMKEYVIYIFFFYTTSSKVSKRNPEKINFKPEKSGKNPEKNKFQTGIRKS